MFENHSPSSRAFLTKWTELTKSNLEHQWPLWGTFEIPKLTFLKAELDNHSSKISQIEWNAYFDWCFETSKCYQGPEIASLQNKILRLTQANKWLKKEKMASEASGSSSLASLSQALPLAPSCLSPLAPHGQAPPPAPSSSFPSMPSTPLLHPQFPLTNSLSKLPLSSELIRAVPLKLSLLRIHKLNPLFPVLSGLKLTCEPWSEIFPE